MLRRAAAATAASGRCAAWRTSPAAGWRATSSASCRKGAESRSTAAAWDAARRSSAGCSGWANIDREEMFRVFNMGIGFVLVVRARAVPARSSGS